MTSARSYVLGDHVVRPGSQIRANCPVSLGTSTVWLPVAITHGSAPGPTRNPPRGQTQDGKSTLATAIAAMPSSRPTKPSCSFVVALMPTRLMCKPRAAAIFAFIA